jgi:hypothetical protein
VTVMANVKLSPARDALLELIAELKDKDLGKLIPTRGTRFKDGAAWFEGLQEMAREIETWCDADATRRDRFTIDVPPATDVRTRT